MSYLDLRKLVQDAQLFYVEVLYCFLLQALFEGEERLLFSENSPHLFKQNTE